MEDSTASPLDLIFELKAQFERGEPITAYPLNDHGEIDPNGVPEVMWPDEAPPPAQR